MNARLPLNQLVICFVLLALLMCHAPILRAEAEDDDAIETPTDSRASLFLVDLDEFYEWLEAFYNREDSEDEDSEDDFDEDDEGDEFEDEDDFEEEFECEDDEDGECEFEEEFECEDDEEGECEFEEEFECEDDEEGECESEEEFECEEDEEGECELEDEFECEDEESEGDDESDGENDEESCGFDITPDQGFGFVNTNPLPDETIHPVSAEAANSASRFLAQATLGANFPLITQVAQQGPENWLESQFNQPVGTTLPYASYLFSRLENLDDDSEAAADRVFEEQGIPESYFGYAWWTQVMTSPDLVRQRVATALTEIFVIGRTVEDIGENPIALATYYDMLLNNSFGNFKDILLDVTLSPAMGLYLSHFENAKANPELGTFPDENYAREVMQLFSIGLFELNADGSRKLDSSGNPIPTYDNDDIREFAKVFTGLGNAGEDLSFTNAEFTEVDLSLPMAMYEQHHDNTEKKLLNGTVLPAGQSGLQDIQGAIDNLFNHPNVGPFIGRLLIQRLVTSNPSPAYIARVTAAFNGDNESPRGDMKAVIRAILLDPEAMNPPELASTSQGRLREPMLRAVHLARAFNANSHDRTFNDNKEVLFETTNQIIFGSPSVFNFFQPDYSPLGELSQQGLVAPEFQITSASTIIGIKNYMSFALGEDGPMQEEGAAAIARLDLTRELALSDSDLIDRLDTKLTYGTLTPTTRSAVLDAITNLSGEQKVRTAIYLIMISPDYTTAI